MEELTEKEAEMLEFITDFTRLNSYPPSIRDIQQGLGYRSTSTVHNYLARLAEKGAIKKSTGKSRSLRTEEAAPDKEFIRVPLVGKVTAGMPILAVENIEGYLEFPLVKRSYREAPAGSFFALHVKGESMIEAGILDDDVIVVQKMEVAENGEIVVALIDDSATVKEFYMENGHIRLQPRNPTMEPIIVNECTILGKVVSVMRFY